MPRLIPMPKWEVAPRHDVKWISVEDGLPAVDHVELWVTYVVKDPITKLPHYKAGDNIFLESDEDADIGDELRDLDDCKFMEPDGDDWYEFPYEVVAWAYKFPPVPYNPDGDLPE